MSGRSHHHLMGEGPLRLLLVIWAIALTAAPVLADSTNAHANPGTDVVEPTRVLVWPFKSNGVDEGTVRTIQHLVTTELSDYPRLSVLSAEDVRRALEVEGERQALGGCDDDSCLIEAAGALGAELVLFGELGQLGDLLFVNLSFLDSSSVKAEARKAIPVPRDQLDTLPGLLKPALQELVVKVLTHRGHDMGPTEPEPQTLRPWPGLAVAVSGALLVTVGVSLAAVAWQLGYVPAVDAAHDIEAARNRGQIEDAVAAHSELERSRNLLLGVGGSATALLVVGLGGIVGGSVWALFAEAE